MSQSYDLRGAEATLQQANKTALYAGILDTCAGMRKKLSLLQSGKLKQAISVFRDPNYPKKQLRIIQKIEDGRLKTSYWMDDSNVWAHCAEKRKQFDTFRKHAATTGTQHMFREYYLSTWLLETYVLLKYNVDMRDSEVLNPTSSEYKKVSWIMDNDSFASRYKLTTYRESINMPNPFERIEVEMRGLDLTDLINNNNKDQADVDTRSTTEPSSNTESDGVNSSDQVQPECSQ